MPIPRFFRLSWSPTANFLASTSWDKTVRIWEVQQTSQTTCNTNPKAMKTLEQPLLSAAWQADGSSLYTAGCDKTVRAADPYLIGVSRSRCDPPLDHPLPAAATVGPGFGPAGRDWPARRPHQECRLLARDESGNYRLMGQDAAVLGPQDAKHGAPPPAARAVLRPCRQVRAEAPFPRLNILPAELSWRSSVLCSRDGLLVAITAGNIVEIFNLQQPQTVFRQLTPNATSEDLKNPLKEQLRCVSCCADGQGFLLGSVEGRAASYYVNDPKRGVPNAKDGLSFSFKCHRADRPGNLVEIYSVNAVACHPKETHALCTGGSDGCYQFWEKAQRRKIASGTCIEADNKPASSGAKQTPVRANNLPIVDIQFNGDGSLMGYAHSYDWSKGHAFNDPTAADPKQKPAIFVRVVQETDIRCVTWTPAAVNPVAALIACEFFLQGNGCKEIAFVMWAFREIAARFSHWAGPFWRFVRENAMGGGIS